MAGLGLPGERGDEAEAGVQGMEQQSKLQSGCAAMGGAGGVAEEEEAAVRVQRKEQGSSGFNGQLRYRSLSPISIDNFLSDIGPISDPMIGDNLS